MLAERDIYIYTIFSSGEDSQFAIYINGELMGSGLDEDSQTPPPKKSSFSKIDFLDVSDDFKQKKNCLKKT